MVLEDFHRLVGETIMFCQRLEHDVKWIYAGMLKGNLYDNHDVVEKKNLGQTLRLLEELDNSDGKPFLSEADYELLNQLREIRNHWAHKSYRNFIYNKGEQYNISFQKEFRRLQNDRNRLAKICDSVEDVRIRVLEKFGRI